MSTRGHEYHAPDCRTIGPYDSWFSCGGTFCCPHCGRTVGYCCGCCLDDGLDDLCDECWSAVQGRVRR